MGGGLELFQHEVPWRLRGVSRKMYVQHLTTSCHLPRTLTSARGAWKPMVSILGQSPEHHLPITYSNATRSHSNQPQGAELSRHQTQGSSAGGLAALTRPAQTHTQGWRPSRPSESKHTRDHGVNAQAKSCESAEGH